MKELASEFLSKSIRYPLYSSKLLWTVTKNKISYSFKLDINFPEIKTVLIETDNRCNRQCVFCPVSKLPKKPQRMSNVMFTNIINELADLNFKGRLGFFLFNEPLLDSRLEHFIRYAKENLPEADLMTSTNGDYLTLNKLSSLFKSGLDYVWVRQYDDEVSEHIQEIKRKLSLLERQSFIISTFKDFTNNRAGDVSTEKVDLKIFETCYKPFYELCIYADGKIPLCCNDYRPREIMGNLHSTSIADVWSGKKFRDYRIKLKHQDRLSSPLCKVCTDPSAKLVY